MTLKESFQRSGFAALLLYSVLYMFLFISMDDINVMVLLSSIIGFMVIWFILALMIQNSIDEDSPINRFMQLLNCTHHLTVADAIIVGASIIVIRFVAAVTGVAAMLPLYFAFIAVCVVTLKSLDTKPWWGEDSMKGKRDEHDDGKQRSGKKNKNRGVHQLSKSDGDVLERKYEWKLDPTRPSKVKGVITLSFSVHHIDEQRRYNPYHGVPMSNEEAIATMFSRFTTDDSMLANVRILANYINRVCSKHRLYEYDRLQFVLDFVQEPNIKYIHDDECPEIGNSTQYVRYPDETLFDKHGDCDCKTMLAAAIFWVMGYNVLFLLSSERQHAALALEYDSDWGMSIPREYKFRAIKEFDGKKYIFCETTNDGFLIGSIGGTLDIKDFTSHVKFEQPSTNR